MGSIDINTHMVNHLITEWGPPLIIALGVVSIGLVLWKLIRSRHEHHDSSL